eukprot:TRINITY_DN2290_c0_g2_i2.p1 TRINITY_DN2290_c0_g2~~TRINITY_DN2290_c0_g2_i2.p1  ORF type:complete len:1694 (+),score=387.62 TRINITY_DN2290_c0_g2_i2:103-5082(+)
MRIEISNLESEKRSLLQSLYGGSPPVKELGIDPTDRGQAHQQASYANLIARSIEGDSFESATSDEPNAKMDISPAMQGVSTIAIIQGDSLDRSPPIAELYERTSKANSHTESQRTISQGIIMTHPHAVSGLGSAYLENSRVLEGKKKLYQDITHRQWPALRVLVDNVLLLPDSFNQRSEAITDFKEKLDDFGRTLENALRDWDNATPRGSHSDRLMPGSSQSLDERLALLERIKGFEEALTVKERNLLESHSRLCHLEVEREQLQSILSEVEGRFKQVVEEKEQLLHDQTTIEMELADLLAKKEEQIKAINRLLKEEKESKGLLESQVATLRASVDLERETKAMEGNEIIADLSFRLQIALKEKEDLMMKYSRDLESLQPSKQGMDPDLHHKIASLESERDHLQAQLSEAEYDVHKTREICQKQLDDLSHELRQVRAHLNKLQEEKSEKEKFLQKSLDEKLLQIRDLEAAAILMKKNWDLERESLQNQMVQLKSDPQETRPFSDSESKNPDEQIAFLKNQLVQEMENHAAATEVLKTKAKKVVLELREKLASSESRNADFEKKVALVEDEKVDLQKRISELQTAESLRSADHQALSCRVQELTLQLVENQNMLKQQIEKYSRDSLAWAHEKDDLEAEVNDLRDALEEVSSNTKLYETDSHHLDAQTHPTTHVTIEEFNRLSKLVVDLESEKESILRQKDAAIRSVEDSTSNKIAELTSRINSLEMDLNARLEEIAVLRAQNHQLEFTNTRLAQLESENQDLANRSERLETVYKGEIISLSSQIADLKQAQTHFEQLRLELEDDRNTSVLQIQRLESRIGELEATCQKQSSVITSQSESIELIKQKAKTAIADLRDKLALSENKLSPLHPPTKADDRDQMTSEVQFHSENEYSVLMERIKTLEITNEGLESKLQVLVGQLENRSTSTGNTEPPTDGKYEEILQENQQLRENIEALESKLEKLKVRAKELWDAEKSKLRSAEEKWSEKVQGSERIILEQQKRIAQLENQINIDTQGSATVALTTPVCLVWITEQVNWTQKERTLLDELYAFMSSIDTNSVLGMESKTIDHIFGQIYEYQDKRTTSLSQIQKDIPDSVKVDAGQSIVRINSLEAKISSLEKQLREKELQLAQQKIEGKSAPTGMIGQKITDIGKQVISPSFFSKKENIQSSGSLLVQSELPTGAPVSEDASVPKAQKSETDEPSRNQLAAWKEKLRNTETQLEEYVRLLSEKEEEFKIYKSKAENAIKRLKAKQSTNNAQQLESHIADLQGQVVSLSKHVNELEIQNRSMQDQLSRAADFESRYLGLREDIERQKESFLVEKSKWDAVVAGLRHNLEEKEQEKKALAESQEQAIKKVEEQQSKRLDELRLQINKMRDRNRLLVEEKDQEILQLRQKISQIAPDQTEAKMEPSGVESVNTTMQQSNQVAHVVEEKRISGTSTDALGKDPADGQVSTPSQSALQAAPSRHIHTPQRPSTQDLLANKGKLVELFTQDLLADSGEQDHHSPGKNELARQSSQIPAAHPARRRYAADLINAPVNPEQELLHIAQLQAQRDAEIQTARDTIQKLIDAVAVHEQRESVLLLQEHKLREEIDNLKRTKKREDVPLEYLKNIIIKYLQTDDIESLLPVISTLLQFSPDEVQRIRTLRPARPSASLSYFTRR